MSLPRPKQVRLTKCCLADCERFVGLRLVGGRVWSPRPGRSSSSRIDSVDCQVVYAKYGNHGLRARDSFLQARRSRCQGGCRPTGLSCPEARKPPLCTTQIMPHLLLSAMPPSKGSCGRFKKKKVVIVINNYIRARSVAYSPSPPGPRGGSWKHDGRGA